MGRRGWMLDECPVTLCADVCKTVNEEDDFCFWKAKASGFGHGTGLHGRWDQMSMRRSRGDP